ncbi:hypothetical protein [Hasllibacter sp. MH4015]|uniref:hypothetical protein n=1 Tax=Hasllibacter sp. MH4015 TaxID=2854029 RepID=UPI001CD4E469|nr:hypothetical protein [Hasllibacter sp. MH4015]
MIDLRAKILLGIFAFVIVASALTIWVVLALGGGTIPVLVPLVLAALLLLVTRRMTRR